MSLARRLGLAALSGILLAASFPKPGLSALAFVALIPLLFALRGASGRAGYLCGHIAGTVQGAFLLSWTGDVVVRFGGAPIPLAVLLVLVLAFAFGVFLGAFGWLQARAERGFGDTALLLSPFFFVTCEFLREHLLFGFPWCLLGYSQVEFPELIQISTFTAVHGVSFLVASVAAGIAYALAAKTRAERRFGLTLPAALTSLALAYGHARVQRPIDSTGALTVGVVQASIPQDQKWESSLLNANIDRHIELSRRAIERGANLVVWPESAVAYELDQYPEVRKQLSELLSPTGAYLLTGNDDRERDGQGVMRSYVGAKLISPEGKIAMRYRKMRLVPFGEYLPLQPILRYLPVRRLVESVSDFTPGTRAESARVFGITVGAFICYEAIFPSLVRRFPANGAEVLINVTNDGWYGTSAAPYQHYAMARFRAVENRRFLIRAANTGISAIVDPYGREIERSELMERIALVGEVRSVAEKTFYARFGDVFAWSITAATVILSLAAALRRSSPSNRLPSADTPSAESLTRHEN